MTDIKATPATEEQVQAWIDLGADGRLFIPAHVIDSLVARIAADAETIKSLKTAVEIADLIIDDGEVTRTIRDLRETIKAKDEEIERLRKVRTGSAVERLHNLCDGFEESDKEREAELATLRAQVETLREALAKAVELYESYGLVAGRVGGDPRAPGRWVNSARAALAATEPKG